MDNSVLLLIETHCFCGENYKDKFLDNREFITYSITKALEIMENEKDTQSWDVTKVVELRDRISSIRLDTGIQEYKLIENKLSKFIENTII